MLKVKSELPDRKQYSKCWRDISIKALPRRRVEFWELYRKACDLHVSIRNGSRMSKAVGRAPDDAKRTELVRQFIARALKPRCD